MYLAAESSQVCLIFLKFNDDSTWKYKHTVNRCNAKIHEEEHQHDTNFRRLYLQLRKY